MAQQLGHTITLDQVQCEPLIDIAMPRVDCEQSIEQLFTSIGKYQAEFEKLKESKNGDRLRFVGRLSVTDGKVAFLRSLSALRLSHVYRFNAPSNQSGSTRTVRCTG